MKNSNILTVYTTVSDEKEAESLIQKLLNDKLIACGVSWPVNSQYNWQGKVVNDGEYIAFLKSSLRMESELMEKIEQYHPYDTPVIMINETRVNPKYGEWVEGEVK